MPERPPRHVTTCTWCKRVIGVSVEVFNQPTRIGRPWRMSRHATVARGRNGGTICPNSRITVDESQVRAREAPASV